MPQYAFLQAMYLAALATVVAVALAMPIGAKAGARAGRLVKRGAFAGLVVALVVCLAWGNATGDLARFNDELGIDAWLQMGAFFGIVLFTANHFVTRYLEDKASAERTAAADDAEGPLDRGDGAHG